LKIGHPKRVFIFQFSLIFTSKSLNPCTVSKENSHITYPPKKKTATSPLQINKLEDELMNPFLLDVLMMAYFQSIKASGKVDSPKLTANVPENRFYQKGN